MATLSINGTGGKKESTAAGVIVPVAVRQDNLVGLTFHPELTDNTAFHAYFLDIVYKWKERDAD